MLVPSAAWAALTLAGILLHLVGDWFLQNDWMANNKAKRARVLHWKNYARYEYHWWLRHPAAYVHASIHVVLLLLVFPAWAALIIGVLHLIIDTRSPLDWWGKFSRQTRPSPKTIPPMMDIGMEVAFWRDQVAHFVVIALMAVMAAIV